MRKTPRILFKYRPITEADRNENDSTGYTRKLLAKGEIYFAKVSELNDPNEVAFRYREDNIPTRVAEGELSKYPHNKVVPDNSNDGSFIVEVDGYTAARKVRDRLKKRWEIFSLTEDGCNSLMFSHYAAGHKGISMGFNWEKLPVVVKKTKEAQLPRKVKYVSVPPIFSITQVDEQFEEIFYTKHNAYSYEKEWRIFYRPGLAKDSKRKTFI